MGACAEGLISSAESNGDAKCDAKLPPYRLYLELRWAVERGHREAAVRWLQTLIATAEPDLLVAGLKVSEPILNEDFVTRVIDQLVEQPVVEERFERQWAAWLKLLAWSPKVKRACLSKKILGELHRGAPMPTRALVLLLDLLLQADLRDLPLDCAEVLFRLALGRLETSEVRTAVIQLHLKTPKVFSLDASSCSQLEQLAAHDARTAFLLGCCYGQAQHPERSLTHLRRGLPVLSRDVKSIQTIFENAMRFADRELARQCVWHLAASPEVDLQTIQAVALWASRVDLAPHWREVLENALLKTRLTSESSQIQTLLCEELFRAGHSIEAVEHYLELPNRELADVGLRMRVIETLVDEGRNAVALEELEQIPEVTREHRMHVLSLRLRTAGQAGDLDVHQRLLEEAPEGFFEDPALKVELAWRHVREQDWSALFRLLSTGPIENPALQAFRLVAAARLREYQVVRSELIETQLELPAQYHWLQDVLGRPFAAAALQSFAVAGQWQRVEELLRRLRFEDPGDPIPAFFRYLTCLYKYLEVDGEVADIWRPLCDAFEQLLILSKDLAALELVVAFVGRSPLAEPSTCPDPSRAHELIAYVQFLMLSRIEELIPKIESRHLEAVREMRGRLQDPVPLQVTLALLRRAEELNEGG